MNTADSILYLDFDGVLHPADVGFSHGRGFHLKSSLGHKLFEHVPVLEQLLEGTSWKIVLSTGWATWPGEDVAQAQLSEGLRARVIGSTYRFTPSSLMTMTRARRIGIDLEHRQPMRWVAIDDATVWPAHWRDRVVITDPALGLGCPKAQDRLARLLRC